MTLRRLVPVALCAFGVAVIIPAAASATTPSRAAFELSATGKRALAARSITLTSVPRGPAKPPSLAIGDWTIGSSAKIALTGALRFSAGKRKVSATRLQVTIGRTSSSVSGRIGKTSVRLFTLTPTRPAVLDAARQRASLVGARFALSSPAAKRLRSSLKLKRTPSKAALGKLTVAVSELALPIPPAPSPTAPTTLPAPAPTPAPTPPPTPGENPCGFAPTPAGSVDWFGCDLPGNNDLRSWTNYVQSAFPPIPCPGGPGSVTASDGATRLLAETAYDHRFPVTTGAVRPDGSATITVQGSITYLMPVHGIDESIGAFRIEIAPGGQSGTVYADGRAKPRDMGADVCTAPAQAFAGEPVLTLDLTGIAPVTSEGVTRWVHVPATIAQGTQRIGGGTYPAGSAWGSFTIAVPER